MKWLKKYLGLIIVLWSQISNDLSTEFKSKDLCFTHIEEEKIVPAAM